MTKAEIIEAALKAWGRKFYFDTSLSHVARELKVCKPALYRHFRSKNALLEAMDGYFLDNFTGFFRSVYEKALNNQDSTESIFMIIRAIAEYYARNVNVFIFSMVKLHDNKRDTLTYMEDLRSRGIDLADFQHSIKKDYVFQPLIMRLINATLVFFVADFHKKGKTLDNPPSEAAITHIINAISEIAGKGLRYSNEEIVSLDYEGLENRIAGTVNTIEDNPLLKAVAAAVAETGPWETSMEQVAHRLGLSKSSLYGHFKNKQDMLHQLFVTEFMRIMDFARQGIRQTALPQEQLYLGIFSIVEYLRSKPDILTAMDWIRNRRINLGPIRKRKEKPMSEFMRLFEEIDIKPLQNNKSPFNVMPEEELWLSPWILFLIINTLMQTGSGQTVGKVPNSDIRYLYRFITLGISGNKINEE
ncbi:MAG: TetR/AcrR family transcriptional regulator [Treponema sp.]|jgi:AcrR family transcriptional regulator|nr:TetR/AcrR family transcriptional regulator [Treponema sp.]